MLAFAQIVSVVRQNGIYVRNPETSTLTGEGQLTTDVPTRVGPTAQLPLGLSSDHELTRRAIALGAQRIGGALSAAESDLVARIDQRAGQPTDLDHVRDSVARGDDPLGIALLASRTQDIRRGAGAVYTPRQIIEPMVEWVLAQHPTRVVDAGCGSGRFALEIARRAPGIRIVAIDNDPLATLLARTTLASIGQTNCRVINDDFTKVVLPDWDGITAFIGNPPYVRHHNLSAETKVWAQSAARRAGLVISGLAGIHAYFYLATALMAKPGDVGCFVTSAEWLDVNYGSIVRELLLGSLGGQAIHYLEPIAMPFEQTATTAAIACFKVGDRPRSMKMRRIKTVGEIRPLAGGRLVARERLTKAARWTQFVHTKARVPEGFIELGELCRVHRGAVTGANAVWITDALNNALPGDVLFPSVTKARELFAAGDSLDSAEGLRRVIDIPDDLDVFDASERKLIEAFLRGAKRAGAHEGYIARYRRTWWSVHLREPAPILATYMARRPPAFVRNLVGARHINIAHGLYPRIPLPQIALDRLAASLRDSVTVAQGRTYAGGLTKFEPKEMERVAVPDLPALLAT